MLAAWPSEEGDEEGGCFNLIQFIVCRAQLLRHLFLASASEPVLVIGRPGDSLNTAVLGISMEVGLTWGGFILFHLLWIFFAEKHFI